MPKETESPTVARGLATIAMLKVNYDLHRDHVAMFEPLLLDTVAQMQPSDFSTDEIRSAMASRHDMRLPVDATRTMLGVLVKSGYLRRDGGRFFLTTKPIDATDSSDRARQSRGSPSQARRRPQRSGKKPGA